MGSHVLYPGGGVVGNFQATNSLIFNDDDSANLTYSASAGDTKKWSIFGWIEQCNLVEQTLMEVGATGVDSITINASNQIEVNITGSSGGKLQTTAIYRDPAYHMSVLVTFDSANGTAGDRLILWVDGVRVTSFVTTTTVPLNQDSLICSAATHNVGNERGTYSDMYLSEFGIADGVVLTPSDLGEFHPDCPAVFRPISLGSVDYSGVNSCHLDFGDATSTTTLGYDVSGNANHWTLNSMATTDQSIDSPTNNYTVLNALDAGSGTLTEGNLVVAGTVLKMGTILLSPGSGKWAWEITVATTGQFGAIRDNIDGATRTALDNAGEVVEFELDLVNYTLKKRVDGGSLENVDLALDNDRPHFPYAEAACTFDFGQKGFTPTDSAFTTICSNNLSAPTILNPADYFDTPAYVGDSAASHVISSTNKADLVNLKNRDGLSEWRTTDVERGATKELRWSDDRLEGTDATGLIAFGASSGFTVGSTNEYNNSGDNFHAEVWTQGVTPGFDIIEITGNGVAGRTVAHGLGVLPHCYAVKNLDTDNTSWAVYHHKLGATVYLNFDKDAGPVTATNIFNDTEPTASVISLGDHVDVNANGDRYLILVWTGVPGFSSFGEYDGNAAVNGTFIPLSFRPAMSVVKRANATLESYVVMDVGREPDSSYKERRVEWDTLDIETSARAEQDFVSNGVKMRNTDNEANASNPYVYFAWAQAPFALMNNSEL